MLDSQMLESVKNYIALLENPIVLKVSLDNSEQSKEMLELLTEIANLSNLIKISEEKLNRTPSFSINRLNEDSGIVFAGIPLGHEFTSLIMALLQVGGRKPKITDDLIEIIKNIQGEYNFETYISLTCHNCPDVVQALNVLSVLNKNIKHTMIDGALYQNEVNEKEIMAVPSVYLNGKLFGNGRMSLEEIIAKLDTNKEQKDKEVLNNKKVFDMLIVGGGPAGASAAIYGARKGINVGMLAEKFGGQVMDTVGIENLIGTKYTEGPKLTASLEEHVKEYNVDIMNLQRVKNVQKNELFEILLENGALLKSKTVIVATGAKWRNLNVPGEDKYKNKGVAYCPHCDGPLFKEKHVAVIGGGNSGVEAAIDLAGIVGHVTLIEFGAELKADAVLQNKLQSLKNATIIKNAQTKEITGDEKVNGITYIERDSGIEKHISLEGVFIQIGLVPNTAWLGDFVEKNKFGEIIISHNGETNVPGLFAAGDCTNIPYKQIVISMGHGANAALGAFDYLIKN